MFKFIIKNFLKVFRTFMYDFCSLIIIIVPHVLFLFLAYYSHVLILGLRPKSFSNIYLMAEKHIMFRLDIESL